MSFGDKAFDAWDWFVGLFHTSYGWRDWTVVALVALFFVVVFGPLFYIILTEDDDYPAATVYTTDGKTVHCDEGHWYGGSFGADNKFGCDDITYTITVIHHVEEEES